MAKSRRRWRAAEATRSASTSSTGFLLAPHLDAAFDAGFISVAEDGAVIVADALTADARAMLGLERPCKVRDLQRAHERYLPWHRTNVFRGSAAAETDP